MCRSICMFMHMSVLIPRRIPLFLNTCLYLSIHMSSGISAYIPTHVVTGIPMYISINISAHILYKRVYTHFEYACMCKRLNPRRHTFCIRISTHMSINMPIHMSMHMSSMHMSMHMSTRIHRGDNSAVDAIANHNYTNHHYIGYHYIGHHYKLYRP